MIRIAILALTVVMTDVGAQSIVSPVIDGRNRFIPMDLRGREYAERIRTTCNDTVGISVLRRLEQVAAANAARDTTARDPTWTRLACVRATLFVRGAKSTDKSFLLPLGQSYLRGTLNVLTRHVAADPDDSVAANLLAVITINEALSTAKTLVDHYGVGVGKEPVADIAPLLLTATRVGQRSPIVLRACTSAFLALAEWNTANYCSKLALEEGADSSWHLLRQAYLRYMVADTLGGTTAFRRALASSHDGVSRAELGWHLETRQHPYYVSSEELPFPWRMSRADKDTWLNLPDSMVLPWIDARWVRLRELDGETESARLITHFLSIAYGGGVFYDCILTAGETRIGSDNKLLVTHFVPCRPDVAPDNVVLSAGGQFARVWDRASGALIGLAAYTVGVDHLITTDVADTIAALQVELHHRDAATSTWRDSTFTRQIRLPKHAPKKGLLTGLISFPAAPATDDWYLAVMQSSLRRGFVYPPTPTPLAAGPIQLSDLIVGDSAQRLSWQNGDETITLAPLGAVQRRPGTTLYYQVRSDTAIARVRTSIAVFPTNDGIAAPQPALSVAFESTVARGLTDYNRGFDVTRLKSGSYVVRVELTDPTGKSLIQRSGALFVQ